MHFLAELRKAFLIIACIAARANGGKKESHTANFVSRFFSDWKQVALNQTEQPSVLLSPCTYSKFSWALPRGGQFPERSAIPDQDERKIRSKYYVHAKKSVELHGCFIEIHQMSSQMFINFSICRRSGCHKKSCNFSWSSLVSIQRFQISSVGSMSGGADLMQTPTAELSTEESERRMVFSEPNISFNNNYIDIFTGQSALRERARTGARTR